MDEPTASLDPKTARQIMRLIRELATERRTPGARQHPRRRAGAQSFADRVIGFKAGRVAFDGPPSALTAAMLTEIYGAEDWSRPSAGRRGREGGSERRGLLRAWRPPPLFGSRARQRLALLGGAPISSGRSPICKSMSRACSRASRARWTCLRAWCRRISRAGSCSLNGMVESVQMAFAATLCGVVLSMPLGLAAARNLAPRPVYLAARGLIVVGRTLHEIIIAIFFVKLFGFGAVAGLLTLAFASAIFLGKMLAEDIENVRAGPVEAVRATGAASARS